MKDVRQSIVEDLEDEDIDLQDAAAQFELLCWLCQLVCSSEEAQWLSMYLWGRRGAA